MAKKKRKEKKTKQRLNILGVVKHFFSPRRWTLSVSHIQLRAAAANRQDVTCTSARARGSALLLTATVSLHLVPDLVVHLRGVLVQLVQLRPLLLHPLLVGLELFLQLCKTPGIRN